MFIYLAEITANAIFFHFLIFFLHQTVQKWNGYTSTIQL